MVQFQREKTAIHEHVNPFLSVWYEPRVAARFVIERKTYSFPLVLALLSGIIGFVSQSFIDNPYALTSSDLHMMINALFGAVGGVIGWIVVAFFMMLFGKMFGGKATFKEMALAVSVGYIPTLLLGFIVLLDMVIIGPRLFTIEGGINGGGELVWLLLSTMIKLILSIWGTIISIKAISEAHRFSSWSGLGTVMIPGIIVFLLVSLLIIVIISFIGFSN